MAQAAREFAVAEPARQTLHESGDLLLAISGDELVQRRGERRMGEGIAFYPGERGFRESLGEIGERDAPLLGAGGVVQCEGVKARHADHSNEPRWSARDGSLPEG